MLFPSFCRHNQARPEAKAMSWLLPWSTYTLPEGGRLGLHLFVLCRVSRCPDCSSAIIATRYFTDFIAIHRYHSEDESIIHRIMVRRRESIWVRAVLICDKDQIDVHLREGFSLQNHRRSYMVHCSPFYHI